MKSIVSATWVLVFSLPICAEEGRTDPRGLTEAYAALLKEYGLNSGMRQATTDLQRKVAVEQMGSFVTRFVELAERHRGDPAALPVLRQAVQIVGSTDSAAQIAWETNKTNFPSGSDAAAIDKLVALVLRHHVLSDKLSPVVDRMRYGYRIEFDACLSAVLKTNPHRDVQGFACLSLAQFLHDKLRMVRLVNDRPELERCYKIVFDAAYLPELRRLERTGLAERVEALFERAVEEFADVPIRGSTVGERAKSELYDIRYLRVGKVAPDIEGQDQDGVEFRLSDYRGKVVMLYFWSEY